MSLFDRIRRLGDPEDRAATWRRIGAFLAAQCPPAARRRAAAAFGRLERARAGDAAALEALRAAVGPPPAAPPPRAGAGRQASRLADVEQELALVKGGMHGGFCYLDLGCAEGRITAALAGELGLPPGRAHACDVAPCPQAAQAAAFTFARNEPGALPYPDASFDLITMFMSAHHFADAAAVFREARRVARPGARLLIREHDCASEGDGLYYDAVHALYECVLGAESTPAAFAQKYAAGAYARYRGAAGWVALAGECGFDLEAGPHGPRNGRDRFDSFYALFVARP